MRLFQSIKTRLKALHAGAGQFLISTTTSLPHLRPVLKSRLSEVERALMTWINRNHFLMSMIDQHDQHVMEATFNPDGVWVNVYLATDNPSKGCRQITPSSEGVFAFHQKEWKGAIGATYAPFVSPVNETIYTQESPLFSFHADYEGNWRDYIGVDLLDFFTVKPLKETA